MIEAFVALPEEGRAGADAPAAHGMAVA